MREKQQARLNRLFRRARIPKRAQHVRLRHFREMGHEAALAAAHDLVAHGDVVTEGGETFCGLHLHGPTGVGKTWLAAAVANEFLTRGVPVLFIKVPALLDHLRETFHPASEVTFDALFSEVLNVPVLILDDLGAQQTTSWMAEKLFQLVDWREAEQLITVVTSNLDRAALLAQFEALDDWQGRRVISRLYTMTFEAPMGGADRRLVSVATTSTHWASRRGAVQNHREA